MDFVGSNYNEALNKYTEIGGYKTNWGDILFIQFGVRWKNPRQKLNKETWDLRIGGNGFEKHIL